MKILPTAFKWIEPTMLFQAKLRKKK